MKSFIAAVFVLTSAILFTPEARAQLVVSDPAEETEGGIADGALADISNNTAETSASAATIVERLSTPSPIGGGFAALDQLSTLSMPEASVVGTEELNTSDPSVPDGTSIFTEDSASLVTGEDPTDPEAQFEQRKLAGASNAAGISIGNLRDIEAQLGTREKMTAAIDAAPNIMAALATNSRILVEIWKATSEAAQAGNNAALGDAEDKLSKLEEAGVQRQQHWKAALIFAAAAGAVNVANGGPGAQ